MLSTLTRPLRRFGGVRAAVLALFLLLIVGGTLAYRYFFSRPGEAAIQLIPGDAMMVWTLDTNPSEQQVAVFKRITDTIKREGLDAKIEDLIGEMFEKSPIGKEVRPYVEDSFAAALWDTGRQSGTNNPDTVFLLALNDPGQVGALLAKHGQKSALNGLEYYRFMRDNVDAAVIANYLVLASKPAALARIESVRNGQVSTVASLSEYQQARAALPKDANMMFFISPTALQKMGEMSKSYGANPLRGMHWMALGATVRDQGIAFDYRCPMDASALPGLKHLGEIAALDPALLKRLPAGAYGLIAYAQPGKYWDYIRDAMGGDPDTRKKMDDGVAEFEKRTGLSVPRDIAPALGGQMVLAVYPDERGPDVGVDGLILFDDSNGADPGALAAKVRAYLERTSAEHGKKGVRFVSTQRDGATVWALDTETEKQMRHGLTQAFEPTPPRQPSAFPGPNGAGNLPNGFPPPNGPGSLPPPPPQAPRPDPSLEKFLQNKTVAYAQVGNAVLLASSQSLLDRAIAAYNGHQRSLAEEPAYAGMRQMLTSNPQSALMVNLAGIMEALRPVLEKQMAHSRDGVTADDIILLFGAANSGLVGSGRYDGQVMTGTLFMPLNYERVIHLIGTAARRSGPSPGRMAARPL